MSSARERALGFARQALNRLLVGGDWLDSTSGRTFSIKDPATGETVAEFADAGPKDALAARRAAGAAQQSWAMWSARPARTLATAACAVRRQIGHEFGEASTGGTSDAVWTSEMGIPTINGLGPSSALSTRMRSMPKWAPHFAVTGGLIGAIGAGRLDEENSHG